MHELSIANSLVEIATQHATAAGADSVKSITLKIGALSCVHRSALEFSFDLVSRDTILQGAQLVFIDLPVVIFCSACDQEVALPGIQRFRCPQCDTPSGDVRQGRELDIECIEIVETEPTEMSLADD